MDMRPPVEHFTIRVCQDGVSFLLWNGIGWAPVQNRVLASIRAYATFDEAGREIRMYGRPDEKIQVAIVSVPTGTVLGTIIVLTDGLVYAEHYDDHTWPAAYVQRPFDLALGLPSNRQWELLLGDQSLNDYDILHYRPTSDSMFIPNRYLGIKNRRRERQLELARRAGVKVERKATKGTQTSASRTAHASMQDNGSGQNEGSRSKVKDEPNEEQDARGHQQSQAKQSAAQSVGKRPSTDSSTQTGRVKSDDEPEGAASLAFQNSRKDRSGQFRRRKRSVSRVQTPGPMQPNQERKRSVSRARKPTCTAPQQAYRNLVELKEAAAKFTPPDDHVLSDTDGTTDRNDTV